MLEIGHRYSDDSASDDNKAGDVTPFPQTFDRFSATYNQDLERGLFVTGETTEYYARSRVEWLQRVLREQELPTNSVLDFGCGVGGSVAFFQGILRPARIVGIDVSEGSLAVARQRYASHARTVSFASVAEFSPSGDFDVAFCNGVFHHIPLAERGASASRVFQSLRPGGVFAFWENNPWNPGTRWVMSRIPFDRDAVTISPPEARRILTSAGFTITAVHHRFFFPRILRALRPLEPGLRSVPFGGQYLVLARRPR